LLAGDPGPATTVSATNAKVANTINAAESLAVFESATMGPMVLQLVFEYIDGSKHIATSFHKRTAVLDDAVF